MHQIGMPTVVSTAEISRKTSLGAAIDLCLEIGGYEPKQVQSELKLDKAQFSRWSSGQEGVTWPKLSAVMDFCGNDAPLLWMVAQREYDLESIRKIETELERQIRLLTQENDSLRRVLMGAGRP
jgi:hypothetical protein